MQHQWLRSIASPDQPQRRKSGQAPTLTRTSAQAFDLAIQKLTFLLSTHHLHYPHNFFLLNSVKLNFSPRGCLANSPINVDTLELQLLGHPDRSNVDYVLSGFREGFRIGFHPNCVKLKSASSNCPSSRDHVGVIDGYLTTEIHAGRVVGPLKTPPFPYLQISRFGVIPKKNKVNAWRLILDLSFPLGHSVNDGIDKSEFPVCYAKVDDAIRLIVKLGKGALMAKVDIKNAYRIVPIHPDDYYLLGMTWRQHYL